MQLVETTTMTRTIVWRRRRAPLLLTSLPVAGMLVLAVVGMTTTRDGIESELEDRAAEALSSVADVDGIEVEVVGRDAVVTGAVDGIASVDALVSSLGRVQGIRTVDVSAVVVGDDSGG